MNPASERITIVTILNQSFDKPICCLFLSLPAHLRFSMPSSAEKQWVLAIACATTAVQSEKSSTLTKMVPTCWFGPATAGSIVCVSNRVWFQIWPSLAVQSVFQAIQTRWRIWYWVDRIMMIMMQTSGIYSGTWRFFTLYSASRAHQWIPGRWPAGETLHRHQPGLVSQLLGAI